MSWLNSIKGFVVESDPEPTPIPSVTISNVPPAAPYVMLVPAIPLAPTDGFTQKLKAKLPPSSIERFDAVMASLAAIPDPTMKLTTAISVLQATAGITLQQLQADYAARLQLLESEVTRFSSDIAAHKTSDVGQREAQVAQIAADIDKKTKEIQDLAIKRETLNQEISAQQAKLAGAQAGFDGAVAALRAQMQDAMGKLGSIGVNANGSK